MSGLLKIIAIGCLVNGMLFMPFYREIGKSFAEQALFFGKYFGAPALVLFILAAMLEKANKRKQQKHMEEIQRQVAPLEQRLLEVTTQTNELRRARLAKEQGLENEAMRG